jgi:hypothetical protein
MIMGILVYCCLQSIKFHAMIFEKPRWKLYEKPFPESKKIIKPIIFIWRKFIARWVRRWVRRSKDDRCMAYTKHLSHNKDKWALNAHKIKIKLSYIKKDTGIVSRTMEDGAPNCKDQAIFMEISEHKMSTRKVYVWITPTRDSSEIVTSRISRHLSDRGVPELVNAQRRVSESGRCVVPSARHWSAFNFPWAESPRLEGTDVNHVGVISALMSDRISSSSWGVKTCPWRVEVSASFSRVSCWARR